MTVKTRLQKLEKTRRNQAQGPRREITFINFCDDIYWLESPGPIDCRRGIPADGETWDPDNPPAGYEPHTRSFVDELDQDPGNLVMIIRWRADYVPGLSVNQPDYVPGPMKPA